jgi:catechol 2,3-dioxygenase-like lactoylglutathione lyase family enzyme
VSAEHTGRVRGIGGIFFKVGDPAATRAWYRAHLGFNTDEYGTNFEWRLADDPNRKGYSQWSPFESATAYFGETGQSFMINYRVDDIESLVASLRGAGVTIVEEIAAYDYGKFVHIIDLDGQRVELWEPSDGYDGIAVATTK